MRTALAALLFVLPVSARAGDACRKPDLSIVLDVGHTPEAYGARSARGKGEYAFNLDLAKVVQKALVADGYTNAQLLLTKGIGAGQLHSRPKRAGQMKADLFLSLHHDAVQDHYLKSWTWLKHGERYADDFQGFSVFVSGLNPRYDDSLALAASLADGLKAAGLAVASHHHINEPGENRPWADEGRGIYRFDELVVLREATMPAVLLESGVIVHRDEEKRVDTPEFRATVARAVVNAVTGNCGRLQK